MALHTRGGVEVISTLKGSREGTGVRVWQWGGALGVAVGGRSGARCALRPLVCSVGWSKLYTGALTAPRGPRVGTEGGTGTSTCQQLKNINVSTVELSRFNGLSVHHSCTAHMWRSAQ